MTLHANCTTGAQVAPSADQLLEHIITECTAAIALTGDSRFVTLQSLAISLRSKQQIAQMERERGLA